MQIPLFPEPVLLDELGRHPLVGVWHDLWCTGLPPSALGSITAYGTYYFKNGKIIFVTRGGVNRSSDKLLGTDVSQHVAAHLAGLHHNGLVKTILPRS